MRALYRRTVAFSSAQKRRPSETVREQAYQETAREHSGLARPLVMD